MIPELKGLNSPALPNNELPPNPYDCEVFVQAFIGQAGLEGHDSFSFRVVTLQALSKQSLPVWARGYVILDVFSWDSVRNAVKWRLDHCRRNTWQEISQELSKYMEWEFDDYRT